LRPSAVGCCPRPLRRRRLSVHTSGPSLGGSIRRRFAPHQLRHAHAVELARRRCAQRHPAPARPRQPRHDLDRPAGHRDRRDHRDGARPPRTDDVRHRRTPALINENDDGGSAARAPAIACWSPCSPPGKANVTTALRGRSHSPTARPLRECARRLLRRSHCRKRRGPAAPPTEHSKRSLRIATGRFSTGTVTAGASRTNPSSRRARCARGPW
jgi:hypothetical protein